MPNVRSAFSRHDLPEVLQRHCPSIEEGAGKAGCPEHPQPVCIGSKHTVVTTSTPEITRLSPRNGFNGFLRALLGDEFLFVTVAKRIDGDLTRLGRFRLRKAWHQQRMPGPHDFAVRSDLNQSSQRTMCRPLNFGEGVEAPFVCAPVLRSQAKPALRLHLRANAAASTASHPAFVTTAKRPSCRERTGRAGRTDLPDGESEIFFAKGLDDPNQIEIAMINRLCERSQTEFRRVGKGALAPCPPSRARRGLWARCRFAHPTQPLPQIRKRVNSLDRFLSRRLICPSGADRKTGHDRAASTFAPELGPFACRLPGELPDLLPKGLAYRWLRWNKSSSGKLGKSSNG